MIEARRRAYLEALGVDVWVARPPAAEPGRLGVGTGSGSTLLVCLAAADCTSELGRDLVRAIGGEPVWAWLHPLEEHGGQALGDIVSGRLITRVLLFGKEPEQQLFRGGAPEIIGSATVSTVPSLQELAVSGIAKQSLWRKLRDLRVATGGA